MTPRDSGIIKEQWFRPIMKWQLWALPTAIAFFLFCIAQFNFLTFHTLAELFAIIVSFIMFALAWTTYDFSKNRILIFLACGYLWIGSLDLLHALTYKGMNLFIHDNGNTAIQLWIGARYSESLLLLSAPLLASKELNKHFLAVFFGLIALILSLVIFSGNFPTGYIDGVGLTNFKIYSEYIINSILLLALFSIFYWGRTIGQDEKRLIALSIFMTMCAELAFTFYTDVYGFFNFIGHIFKLYSFWFIFHAIILSNLKAPYAALQESKEQLSEALCEAERANQAKSEFLASMSHDFRTPLNAIVGFSDMMSLQPFGPLGDERYEEYVKDIHDSGSLLISLINDILDLSKIESGKYELENIPLSIAPIAKKSLRQLVHMPGANELTITTDIPDNLPQLNGDERVMIQIFNNLLSNAIKFTPAKGKISINAYVDENNSIVINITDTGIGISDEELCRAIKPFEQADSARVRKHGGTGLGLYLCSNFMELFGGALHIQSEKGCGTTVTLNFPAERTLDR